MDGKNPPEAVVLVYCGVRDWYNWYYQGFVLSLN